MMKHKKKSLLLYFKMIQLCEKIARVSGGDDCVTLEQLGQDKPNLRGITFPTAA